MGAYRRVVTPTLTHLTDKAIDQQTVLGYMEKYCHKLVGHAISRADRTEPFVVDCTNNIS